jgi:tRNA G10  N-methylase Trm11
MNFFALGSHPSLSIAEIAAVVGFQKKYSLCSKEILLLDEVEESPENLQNRLAGTVKIGDIIGEVKKINKEEIADLFVAALSADSPRHQQHQGRKIVFGISVYSLDARQELSNEVKQIGMTVKNKLKNDGYSARFVSSKTPNLPSVAVTGEKLLENGAEFVFITSKEKIYLGQTRTVQDFQAWSARDYGRPARDPKSGMLPPKLARMMINLATPPLTPPQRGGEILDPFCGSGTILMEAALLGFKKIIGSDISEKAVKDTKTNLTWLDENFGTQTSEITLYTQSVENLAEILKTPVDTIVAETYLGPPLTGRETDVRQKQILDELSKMATSTFIAIKKLLKTNGVAILALPAFQKEKPVKYLPTKKLAEAAGLKIIPFQGNAGEVSPNGGLLYAREGQRVGREIVKIYV